MQQQTNPAHVALRIGGTVLCFLLMIGVGAVILRGIRSHETRNVVTSPAIKNSQAHAGERWILTDDALRDTLPVGPKDISDTMDYVNAGGVRLIGATGATQTKPADTFTQNELQTSGRVFLVQVGTPCIVRATELSSGTATVQIAEGVHSGETGEVYTAWLQKPDAPGSRHMVRIDGQPTLNDKLKALWDTNPYGSYNIDFRAAEGNPNYYP